MAQKRPRSNLLDQWAIPTDLTSQLVERLNDLPTSVKTDYLRSQILSKYVSSETDSPALRRERAIAKWLETELRNEETNERLLSLHEEYQILPRVSFGSFVEWCQRFIIGIIGEYPPEDALIGSFSGGASTSRKRTESHPALKYLGEAHITPRCLEVWNTISEDLSPYGSGPLMPGWLGTEGIITPVVVPGNVLFTVPKKTDIDRVACKEPDLNMFIQKGIGDFFRRRLLRAGINLNDQSINRSFAREGSISGALATLDLSSASDSVSRELVFMFLPVYWHTLLDSVRSPVTIIDGEEHRNQMFSSMGNGFTFELESLLFYTLARAVSYFRGVPGVVSVYGDDIICPTDTAGYLEWVLNVFGFLVNKDKSFTEGPFRESCGGHYHDGIDITPFYIKRPIGTLPDLIDVANKLRKWAEIPGLTVLNYEVELTWLWLKSFVPDVLWGGWDTSFKYQLVSKDTARCRLVEQTKRRSTDLGGYFHWLNATWDRSVLRDAVETSSRTDGTGRFRLRPVNEFSVKRPSSEWYHEVYSGDVRVRELLPY